MSRSTVRGRFRDLSVRPEEVFDPQQPGHHLGGADVGHADLGDHVQERLICIYFNRFRLVDGRQTMHDKARLDQRAHRQ